MSADRSPASSIKTDGPPTVSKERETRCPRCLSRVSKSPTKPDIEYGHKRDCPRRPDGLGWSHDTPYDPESDPLLLRSDDRTYCDGCGSSIDPQHHRVEICDNCRYRDLCLGCQRRIDPSRLHAPISGGER